MKKLMIRVEGKPAPVGSYMPRQRKDGRLFLLRANAQAAEQWRRAVVTAAKQAMRDAAWPAQTDDANYTVSLSFLLPKPKTVKREQPTVKPDIDKLCRSTLDALTVSGAISDDARVTQLIACKTYAMAGEQPGAHIIILDTKEED